MLYVETTDSTRKFIFKVLAFDGSSNIVLTFKSEVSWALIFDKLVLFEYNIKPIISKS